MFTFNIDPSEVEYVVIRPRSDDDEGLLILEASNNTGDYAVYNLNDKKEFKVSRLNFSQIKLPSKSYFEMVALSLLVGDSTE